MDDKELREEMEKCRNDLRYFYNKYYTLNGQKAPEISEEEWKIRTSVTPLGIKRRRGK